MMGEARDGHCLWAIALSLLFSLLLMVWPLSAANQWLRPEWTALLIIYWAIVCPQHSSLLLVWGTGIVLDILEGTLLGQHALSLMGVSYICLLSYQRLRNYVVLHQALIVFVMVGISQLIDHWVHSLAGGTVQGSSLKFLLPALMSALVWPLLWIGMERLRWRFRID